MKDSVSLRYHKIMKELNVHHLNFESSSFVGHGKVTFAILAIILVTMAFSFTLIYAVIPYFTCFLQ